MNECEAVFTIKCNVEKENRILKDSNEQLKN